jgi:hypothetical protein
MGGFLFYIIGIVTNRDSSLLAAFCLYRAHNERSDTGMRARGRLFSTVIFESDEGNLESKLLAHIFT